jgi:hypothetical protein
VAQVGVVSGMGRKSRSLNCASVGMTRGEGWLWLELLPGWTDLLLLPQPL